MTRLLIVAALALTLSVTACGESAEDRAQDKVCSARADIKKQVDELKSTTVSTASLDGVRSNLKAIQTSLQQIADAQRDLSGDRKQELQKANEAFKSQVSGVGRDVLAGVASGGGEQQVKAALQGLADSYQKTLAPISCS